MADEEHTNRRPMRITCPVCGRPVVPRGDGSVRHHRPPPGSDTPRSPGGNCEGGYR